MKKIIVIAIFVAIGWYGNYLYKQYGPVFVKNSSTDLVHKNEVKCITKNGSIIYGSVPHGTVCERVEPIKGSLTVVPGQKPSRKEDDQNSSFIILVKKTVEFQVSNVMVEYIAHK